MTPDARHLDVLKDRRRAGVLLAAVAAALIARAVLDHAEVGFALVCVLAAGTALAAMCHAAFRAELWTLATRRDAAGLPDVARLRRQLVAPGTRRELARELRDVAGVGSTPVRRRAGVPMLEERVPEVRSELLDVAGALETSPRPDPACVAQIHELLRDGASPLYNPRVPAATLYWTLRSVRAGL